MQDLSRAGSMADRRTRSPMMRAVVPGRRPAGDFYDTVGTADLSYHLVEKQRMAYPGVDCMGCPSSFPDIGTPFALFGA